MESAGVLQSPDPEKRISGFGNCYLAVREGREKDKTIALCVTFALATMTLSSRSGNLNYKQCFCSYSCLRQNEMLAVCINVQTVFTVIVIHFFFGVPDGRCARSLWNMSSPIPPFFLPNWRHRIPAASEGKLGVFTNQWTRSNTLQQLDTQNVNTVTNQLITHDASVFILVVSVCSL